MAAKWAKQVGVFNLSINNHLLLTGLEVSTIIAWILINAHVQIKMLFNIGSQQVTKNFAVILVELQNFLTVQERLRKGCMKVCTFMAISAF